MSDFATLPKLDLQLELLGAAPARFVRDLAARYRVDISGIFAQDGGYLAMDAALRPKVEAAIASVLRSAEDYHRLLQLVLEQAAEAGVIYAEIFLSPLLCGGGALSAWAEHLAALQEAATEAGITTGVASCGIAMATRDLGPEVARKAARLAAETAGGWLGGFAVMGEDDRVSAKDLAWPADCSREAGLALALGLGAAQSPLQIREAVALLVPNRLHGALRMAEDPALVEALAERALALVVSPQSDLVSARWRDMRQHPIGELDRCGVKLALGSETPALSRTPFARQFDAIHRSFDWDEAQFQRLARQALDAAFCDGDRKKNIKPMLES